MGISHAAIGRRVKAGRVHLIHRGVYAVGHAAITWHARGHAALLAAGPDSGLSHASGAIAYRIRRNEGEAFEVTGRGRSPRNGVARLARLIDETEPTRSELERALAEIIRLAGLPRPRFNARAGRFEVDALWERERVVVETDGWRTHGPRAAFERDRAKDVELIAAGYVVLRFTWRQVVGEPLLVATRIAQLVAGR